MPAPASVTPILGIDFGTTNTTAALYCANLRAPKQTVMVFDPGGGTFDATPRRVEQRVEDQR